MRHPSPDALTARHGQVRAALTREGLDALVLTHLPNVRYLTGFGGSAGVAVVRPDELVFVTDGRYAAEVERAVVPRCPGLRFVPVETTYEETLAQVLGGSPAGRVGVEAGHMTVGRYRWLQERLGRESAACTLIPVDRMVEAVRVVKDADEAGVFRAAAALLDDVVHDVLAGVRAGQSELELAAEIDYLLKRRGFERTSFDTIVASGPNAALPHARPGDRLLAPGDLVILDFGGVLGGYCVDLSRTIGVGEVSDEARAWHAAVLDAQSAALAVVAPGVLASEVDAAARQVLEARGLGAQFLHSTGHGLGLEIHEDPRIGPVRPGTGAQTTAADERLQPGMVVTIEPGVYVAGRGGVRIEDDVLVTDSGCVVLTQAPRELYLVKR